MKCLKWKTLISAASLSLLLTGAGCSSEDVESIENETPGNGSILVSVADTSSTVAAERAADVAVKFAKRNFSGSRAASGQIEEVLTVRDSTGTPTMYIINFADNNGFVIVSATKGYYPVLAQSETGRFGIPGAEHPASLWLDIQNQYITHSSDLTEEVKDEIAECWSEYPAEEELSAAASRAVAELPQVYYDSLQMWSTSGKYSGV